MRTVFTALTFLAASPALAAQGYIGAGFGEMTVQDVEPVDFGPGIDSSVDDSDTSLKFFAGVQLTPNFAAEFSYEDLGEASISYTDGIDTLNVGAEIEAMSLSLLGSMPLQRNLSIFGRFGFARSEVDQELTSTFTPSSSDSDTSTAPMFGLGLQYDIQNVMLRAEYTRYKDVGEDGEVEGNDIDVFGLGAGLSF